MTSTCIPSNYSFRGDVENGFKYRNIKISKYYSIEELTKNSEGVFIDVSYYFNKTSEILNLLDKLPFTVKYLALYKGNKNIYVLLNFKSKAKLLKCNGSSLKFS
jgi:hypothetical protein